jgi:SPP1 family predicted phage head-tail adaptor
MPLSSRIHAGRLRHQIKIVDLVLAQDTFGGTQIDSGAVFAVVWAEVLALSGRELEAAQQKVSEVTHRITLRYLPGIVAQQNVWFDDRQFQIEDVEDPDERRKILFLLCIERDNSAREEGGSAG